MGEIADGMINGEFCYYCCGWTGVGNVGFPVYCSKECKDEHELNDDTPYIENGEIKND